MLPSTFELPTSDKSLHITLSSSPRPDLEVGEQNLTQPLFNLEWERVE